MSFLDLEQKQILVFGVANRKSVAYHIAKGLKDEGAKVIFAVHTEERKESLNKLLKGESIYVCDVEKEGDLEKLNEVISKEHGPLDGLVHSIAFANYSEGLKPFHESNRKDFLQATQISAFSLVEMAGAFKDTLKSDASVVSIGISSTFVTAENYGFMAPIKASLLTMTRYLAKSFSHHSQVRFNLVGAGPLKTASSAGIPGYMDNYLYAEKLTFRKQALKTQEVSDTVLFLLSPKSSGVNGAELVVDAGLGMNYFDQSVVKAAVKPE
ncbi:MAG: SDR family oxidoreductase [Planctomycetes bacterium]|nr:SDR family oxidoreductase [Planctomycetota bacterium]